MSQNTCLSNYQDVQLLKFGKFSFHRIITTWILDHKCSLLSRIEEQDLNMDVGFVTQKEDTYNAGQPPFQRATHSQHTQALPLKDAYVLKQIKTHAGTVSKTI